MWNRLSLQDAQQSALGFLISQASYIEPQVIAIQYPDVQYPALIPVDTSADRWAKSITYISSDKLGRADWFHHQANDIPLADVVRERFEQGIEMAGIGYRYTLEELGQAMQLGQNLTPDKAAAARRAYEEFVDDKALRGETEKSWYGLINNPDVTVVMAQGNGNNGESAWSEKSAEQVIDDINQALTGIYTESLTVEMADTVLLPIAVLTNIANRQMPNTTMTILDWVRQHNVYTMQTGAPLTIRGVRGLERAGAGDTGRMVAYRRDPQVLKMHIPMPHEFLPPWQRGPIMFDVPGIFRLGPLEIRRPAAVRYVDGINPTPYQ